MAFYLPSGRSATSLLWLPVRASDTIGHFGEGPVSVVYLWYAVSITPPTFSLLSCGARVSRTARVRYAKYTTRLPSRWLCFHSSYPDGRASPTSHSIRSLHFLPPPIAELCLSYKTPNRWVPCFSELHLRPNSPDLFTPKWNVREQYITQVHVWCLFVLS